MLSKRAKYGLKAMIGLARDPGGPMRIEDLARQEKIPKKFLELILLDLRNQGFLRSKKGAGGGYALARPADLIGLGQLVRVLDGPLAPIPCVSQTAYETCDDCADEQACELRIVMKKVRDEIARVLDGTTLADAVAKRSAGDLAPPAPPGGRRRASASPSTRSKK
ncbi:MAG: Rrf2 family transcriptional regulator [Thermoanaerobaculia bacterium]